MLNKYTRLLGEFRTKHKRLTNGLVIVLVLFLFFYYFLIDPALTLYNESKIIPQKIRPIRNSFSRQDLATLKFELEYFRSHLVTINSAAKKIGIFSPIPWLGGYASDLKNVAGAGLESYDATVAFLQVLIPNLPQINFGGWASDAAAGTQGSKISQLVHVLPSVSNEFPNFKGRVENIKRQVDGIDEKRYPATFRGKNIRSLIYELKQGLTGLSFYFDDIGKALEAAPEIMGTKKSNTYLVVIQNDKEPRPGGGLMAGYAALVISNGNFMLARSGDIFFLDEKLTKARPGTPNLLAGVLGNSLFVKDANYSPDFKTSAKNVSDFWEIIQGNNGPLDGVVLIDTKFLKTILENLGGVNTNPPVNADNIDATMQSFFKYAGSRDPASRQSKDLVSFILNELLKKAFAGNAKNLPSLGKSVLDLSKERHVQVYFRDSNLQALAEKLDLTGQVKDAGGDYLNVNVSTYSKTRLDYLLYEEVEKQTKTTDDGTLETQLTIKFNQKAEGFIESPAEANYLLRLLVPKGSVLLKSQGLAQDPTTSEDLGKSVFSGWVNLKTGQDTNVTINYSTPKLGGERYKLFVQKQPGTDGFKYKTSFNGKTQEFVLSKDTELTF